MNFSRNFQLGAMVVCVAALAGIYLNTRGHRELAGEGGASIVAAAPTPNPSTPASSAQPAATAALIAASTPAPPPLPKSKAEILAAIAERGLTLEPVELSNKPTTTGATAYRVKVAPLGIAFAERDGKLERVEAMALTGMAEKHLTELRGFAAIVGEVSTGLPRGGVLQVVDLLLADVGSSPRGFSRTVDDGKRRFKFHVTRHDDGGYSITFAAE